MTVRNSSAWLPLRISDRFLDEMLPLVGPGMASYAIIVTEK